MAVTGDGDPAALLVKEFCSRLKQTQAGCGLTQNSLARRLGKSQAAVSDILNGKIRLPPSWDDVAAIVTICAEHARKGRAVAPGADNDLAQWRHDYELLTRFVDALRGAGNGGDPVAVLVRSFSGRLRELLSGCGLRQSSLALQLGKSEAAVSLILNGKTRLPPSWDDVAVIVTACAGHAGQERAAVLGAGVGLAQWRRDHEMVASFVREWRRATGHARPGVARAATAVPRQLPADVRAFTGRAGELAELDRLLATGSAGPAAMLICAVSGTAGVGKTALAVRWAHRVRDLFPDGQLYVNLRGYDPGGEPMPAAEALAGFLRALGEPGQDCLLGQDELAARYRSLLDARRMLVLLDNARSADQVRPLLPGTPSCAVIVTSRDSLAGLVARDGATRLDLDLLPAADAVALLRTLAGTRVDAEPASAAALADECARLPLALRVAAELAAARPATPLAELAGELASQRHRLDLFDAGGDTNTAVRAVFSWSYRNLSPAAARMFRLLGLHPGPDVTGPAAASLAGTDLAAARRLLRELARGHLLAEPYPGRYAFHDLLRAYAAERADAQDGEGDRRAAVRRLLDHYLHTAHAAAMLLDPPREPVTLAAAAPGVTPEPLAGRDRARDWFAAEHLVLLAAIALAGDAGSDVHAWQLPWAMSTFLDWRGQWRELAAVLQGALAAATRLGDKAGQAVILRLSARNRSDLGEYDQAREYLSRCPALYRELGDRVGEARVHQSLGRVAELQGWHAQALEHGRRALAPFREAGDRLGEAGALNAVGWGCALLGEYEQAREFCRQALELYQDLGTDHSGEAAAWDSLGYAEHHLGRHADAAASYRRSVSLNRDLGNRVDEAGTLTRLGDTQHAAGDRCAARDAWQQALAILDDLNHPGAGQVRAKLRSLEAVSLAEPTSC